MPTLLALHPRLSALRVLVLLLSLVFLAPAPSHAAANEELKSFATLPAVATQASVGTTWQEFDLHTYPRTQTVTVYADGAIYIAFTGWSQTDGASPSGDTYIPVDATNAAVGYTFALPARKDDRPTEVFVAAQSGTALVRVLQE